MALAIDTYKLLIVIDILGVLVGFCAAESHANQVLCASRCNNPIVEQVCNRQQQLSHALAVSPFCTNA